MIRIVSAVSEVYECDYCGRSIHDKTRASVTAYCGEDVWFEWWVHGDYCEECCEALMKAITSRFGIPERYSGAFRDSEACIKAEIDMIALQNGEVILKKKYVSLFSGIEAATVAWEPLGWEPVCFAEFDEFPSAVLAERYPEVPNVGDVTKANWKKYRNKVDLVVGGSPCQSFSIAGKREGLQGESGLMFEYIRAVREIRPRWFLWENVPGALSSENGEAFRQLLSEMDKLGYGLAWRVLDAQFFGVAQRRRRLFLVGHLGACPPVGVLIEPESMRGDLESSAEKRASLAEAARRSPACAGFKYHQGSGAGGVGAEPEQSPTLTADWHNPAVYPIDEPITMADLNANTAIGYDMVGTLKVGGDAPSVCI